MTCLTYRPPGCGRTTASRTFSTRQSARATLALTFWTECAFLSTGSGVLSNFTWSTRTLGRASSTSRTRITPSGSRARLCLSSRTTRTDRISIPSSKLSCGTHITCHRTYSTSKLSIGARQARAHTRRTSIIPTWTRNALGVSISCSKLSDRACTAAGRACAWRVGSLETRNARRRAVGRDHSRTAD